MFRFLRLNCFRRTRHETANTAKAPADPAANTSSNCSGLDLNNKGTERMRAAPLKLNPNINIANNLFIETPLTLRIRTMETTDSRIIVMIRHPFTFLVEVYHMVAGDCKTHNCEINFLNEHCSLRTVFVII